MTINKPPVTIKLNYVRHSARKLRPVLKMFNNKPLLESIEKSSLMFQDSARILHQALKMAQAAATQKEFLSDDMLIKQVFATEGPKIKRIRPNARGRTNKYVKHLAHVTVMLDVSSHPKKSTSNSNAAAKPIKKKIETTVRTKKGK